MNYTIFRDGQQYGPYTLADLQRYVSSGEVLLTDMATSEGISEPVPVSQIIGNIPAPADIAAAPVRAVEYPNPPNLHWGLVFILSVFTWGLFAEIWGVVLSLWLKKVQPDNKALNFYIAEGITVVLIFFFAMLSAAVHVFADLALLLVLASAACSLIARFNFRTSMEKHYNDVEGIPVKVNPVMTFLFGAIYFQDRVNYIMSARKLFSMSLPASK